MVRAIFLLDVSAPVMNGDGFEFRQVARRPAWLRVELAEKEFKFTGWVRRSEVTKAAGIPFVVGSCGCGVGRSSGGHIGIIPGNPVDQYLGSAKLSIGTKIFSSSAGSEWAFVREELQVWVRHQKGAQWAEVVSIQGIESSRDDPSGLNAYVAVSDVLFPSNKIGSRK